MPPARHRNREYRKPINKKSLTSRSDENLTPSPDDAGLVYPSNETAFKALLTTRFCAAIWSYITDCDETYNYWEPTHYLLFNKGFQTWEYSPQYALRSYTYIYMHCIPAWVYHKLLQPNRILIFYFLRCLLGLFCALCELYFYKSVCREFGVNIGRLLLAFLIFGAGMFISSTAYLPSSFSMYMCMLSLGAWYQRKYEFAVFTTAISCFLSWPFAALLSVPIAVDMLFRRLDVKKFISWSALSSVVLLPVMVKIDSDMFGKIVVAPYNIIKYNVFTSHGPDLYGTEPWSFYFVNGFLNFNFVFLAALLTPVMLVLVYKFVHGKPRHPDCLPYWLSLSPLFLWMGVFFTQPHKEERFLFPVYPLFCLCGAVSVDALQKLYFCFSKYAKRGTHYLSHTTPIMIIAMVLYSLLSISRGLALYRGYHAPMDIFMELSNITVEHRFTSDHTLNVCIGKEWYRYPSSFFLPDNNWHLRFLKSGFRGQLPKPYSPYENGTAIIPSHMNDKNKEEPSRYFNIDECHFLVDLDLGTSSKRDPNYSNQTDKWTVLASVPFLDASKSHRFFRAFYVPFLSESLCHYAPYNLLQSTKLKFQNETIHDR